jgi:hypothetical protein
MRKRAAANESLKFTLHEQRGTTFVVMLVELPKEGLQLFAYHAVQHPALRGATYIRSRDLGTRRGSVKLHELSQLSRGVPRSSFLFSGRSRRVAVERSGEMEAARRRPPPLPPWWSSPDHGPVASRQNAIGATRWKAGQNWQFECQARMLKPVPLVDLTSTWRSEIK